MSNMLKRLKILSVFLSSLFVIKGQRVPVLDILEDGHINYSSTYYCSRNISSVPSNMYSFSICFWLYSYRYYERDIIISIQDQQKNSVLTVELEFGQLYVTSRDCRINTAFKINHRRWLPICIIYAKVLHAIFNGTDYSSDCTLPVLDSKTLSEINVGDKDHSSFPVSGKIGDFQIFFDELDVNDYRNVLEFKTASIPGVSFIENSENITFCSETIKKSSVNIKRIISNYDPEMILHFSSVVHYKEAEEKCTSFGGKLPAYISNGTNNFVDLIHKYVENTLTPISQFWLNRTQNASSCHSGLFSTTLPNNIRINKLDCRTDLMFFCVISKNQTYHLVKNDIPEQVNIFYPIEFSNHQYSSPSYYSLAFNYTHFTLKDVVNNLDIGSTPLLSPGEIIGRKEWDTKINGLTSMAFSACEMGMYTCSNGECLEMKYVCDSDKNCLDGSDEEFCDPILPAPKSYNILNSPNTPETTKVGLEFTLSRVVNIDMDKHIVILSLKMSVEWIDPRLQFKQLRNETTILVSQNNNTKIWQPRIYIEEAVSEDMEKFDLIQFPESLFATAGSNGRYSFYEGYEVRLFDGKDVKLKAVKMQTINILCEMDMFPYPFDTQECPFTLKLVGSLHAQTEFDEHQVSVKMDQSCNMALYQHLYFNVTCNDTERNVVHVLFAFSRKFAGFAFTTFFPCMILELIGLLTHMFPTDDYQDRVTVTLSCLIVMAALATQLSNILPESADPKLTDIWMAAHVAILFCVFLVHVVVILLSERAVNEKGYEGKGKVEAIDYVFMVNVSQKEKEKKKPKIQKVLIINRVGFITISVIYFLFLAVFAHYSYYAAAAHMYEV